VQALTVTGSTATTRATSSPSTRPSLVRPGHCTGGCRDRVRHRGNQRECDDHGNAHAVRQDGHDDGQRRPVAGALDCREPAATTLAPGATQALTVNATYNNATTRPVTAGSTFVSSNPSAATVDAAGVVAAVPSERRSSRRLTPRPAIRRRPPSPSRRSSAATSRPSRSTRRESPTR